MAGVFLKVEVLLIFQNAFEWMQTAPLGSVCGLLPVQVALRSPGDSPFQWTFVTGVLSPNLGFRLVSVAESPTTQWPGSTLTK